VNNKEVDCGVNMYIRLNGDFLKGLLHSGSSHWHALGTGVGHFDHPFRGHTKMGNMTSLQREECRVLTLMHRIL